MVARRRLQRGKEILTCVVDKAIWNPNGRLYDVIPSRRRGWSQSAVDPRSAAQASESSARVRLSQLFQTGLAEVA